MDLIAIAKRQTRTCLTLVMLSLHGTVSAATIPNDPLFPQQWALKQGIQYLSGDNLDLPTRRLHTSAAPIVVAVLDTGVDYNHEDLAANMWVNQIERNGSEQAFGKIFSAIIFSTENRESKA